MNNTDCQCPENYHVVLDNYPTADHNCWLYGSVESDTNTCRDIDRARGEAEDLGQPADDPSVCWTHSLIAGPPSVPLPSVKAACCENHQPGDAECFEAPSWPTPHEMFPSLTIQNIAATNAARQRATTYNYDWHISNAEDEADAAMVDWQNAGSLCTFHGCYDVLLDYADAYYGLVDRVNELKWERDNLETLANYGGGVQNYWGCCGVPKASGDEYYCKACAEHTRPPGDIVTGTGVVETTCMECCSDYDGVCSQWAGACQQHCHNIASAQSWCDTEQPGWRNGLCDSSC